jgi:hypothetical protein
MKRTLLNTKVKDFQKLSKEKQEDVLYITENFLKSNRVIRLGRHKVEPKFSSLWDIKYSEMIQLKGLIENTEYEKVIELLYNLDIQDISSLSLFNALSAYKYVVEEMKAIVKAEEEKLSSKPTQKEISAGIENFQEFGEYNTIRMLTGGDKSKEKFYLDLPYSEVFLEICYISTQNQYQKKLYKS